MKTSAGMWPCLNRDAIKAIAMATMFVNHFANTLLSPDHPLFEPLVDIGYFTAVTMCYFLAEGYHYTHDRKAYALRLLIFAVIAQIPYQLALGFAQLNMLFTLLDCFLILHVMNTWPHGAKKALALFGLVVVSIFMDWALLAPVFTLLFGGWKGSRIGLAGCFGAAAALFFGFSLLGAWNPDAPEMAVLHAALTSLGILAAGAVILLFYNGRRAEHGRVFWKWFFYLFYPAHLAVLAAVKLLVLQ